MTFPEPAPLNKRAMAFALDLLIVLMGLFTVWVVFWILVAFATAVLDSIISAIAGHEMSKIILKPVLLVLWSIVAFLFPVLLFGYYHARLDASVIQGSIGKMCFGLRVVDTEGKRLTMKAAWWRAMNKLLSILILFGGFIPAFTNPQRQAMHDKMSGTLVV